MKLEEKIAGMRAIWHFDNRWQLIVNRTFFKQNELLVYKCGPVEFLVDHGAADSNGTRACVASDIYKRFVPQMQLHEPLRVFDLGANGGGFPLMLLLSGKRISNLLCVEMNPNTFLRLEYNVKSNVDGEVALVQGAVCASRKTLHLNLGRGSTHDTIYQNGDGASSSEYSVEGYSFDDLFERHFGQSVVDICKMDVEGAEYEIFLSGKHSNLKRCRYLLIEIHQAPVEQQQQLRAILEDMGFSEVTPEDGKVTAEHLYRNTGLN